MTTGPRAARARSVAVAAGGALLLISAVVLIVDPQQPASPASAAPDGRLDAQGGPCYFLLQPPPASPLQDGELKGEAETCHDSDGPTLLPPAGDEEPRIAEFPNLRPRPSSEHP